MGNEGSLPLGFLGTKFNEIQIRHAILFKHMLLKMLFPEMAGIQFSPAHVGQCQCAGWGLAGTHHCSLML